MIDHIDFAVLDLTVSRKFYETVLSTLGIEPFMDFNEGGRAGTGYGSLTGAQFWIGGGEAVKGRMHIAFAAKSRAEVDAFHSAALRVDGVCKGVPGIRPVYGEHYYAAFIIDSNGHKIEAVCRKSE